MFTRVMVPVDLGHVDKLQKSLKVSAELAQQYKIPITYVGITSSLPGALGHNPQEYAEKLKKFADSEGLTHQVLVDTHTIVSPDPAADLDKVLARAVSETGADLIVMATHVPSLADHFLHSHGGHLATHTDASVFLVRG